MAIDAPAKSTVKAELKFSTPPADGSAPEAFVADYSTNYVNVPHEIEIENVRGKEDQYTLDTAGFQLLYSPASHKSFKNDEEIKNEYYKESIELIKKQTGASRVVIFDHSEQTSPFLCATIRAHRPS